MMASRAMGYACLTALKQPDDGVKRGRRSPVGVSSDVTYAFVRAVLDKMHVESSFGLATCGRNLDCDRSASKLNCAPECDPFL